MKPDAQDVKLILRASGPKLHSGLTPYLLFLKLRASHLTLFKDIVTHQRKKASSYGFEACIGCIFMETVTDKFCRD
jgi:hypothetical protein